LPGLLEVDMKHLIKSLRAGSAALAAGLLLAGCMTEPPGPSPIYSRLPSAQTQPPLSEQQQEQYNQIDRQVMAEQQQAMAADAAARVYSYPYYAAPVSVYGGYYGGGWGNHWGSGIGVSYGTGYGW
jgi:hypothetical protein